jgi:hypothetical protein
MPTTIIFAASRGDRPLSVSVEEDVSAVYAAWTAANGLPFALSRAGSVDEVIWVNPATVAFWRDASRAGGPPSSSPVMEGKMGVTR